MDIDKRKNDFLTSYNTCSEIADIQSKFYSWYAIFIAKLLHMWLVKCLFFILFLCLKRFEDKGIINNLRAHIKEQMITALEDSPMWNTNKRNVTSPKIQAINLLVADFLMKQENLFTLSVFITEVGFILYIFVILHYYIIYLHHNITVLHLV